MNEHYTIERNTQIVIALLKAHGIKKVIASPGTTNIRLVTSMQHDSFFEMYSAADERSAAYMACGMAAESGEPVVLSCTGATASRNYIPALTEAFYRKLPVLAITSTQHKGRVGQNVAQVLDRSVQMNDTLKLSVFLPSVESEEDAWACAVNTNRAILELTRQGGGPAHIDLETNYSTDFSVTELPPVQAIYRITPYDTMPQIPNGRVCIFVGAHQAWTPSQIEAIDHFCESYNAVVLCDQTSNYKGKYRILFSLVTSQYEYHSLCQDIDLLIYIGDISGAYPRFHSKCSWRVNPDGEIRDVFKNMSYVFEMKEETFFETYAAMKKLTENTQITEWKEEEKRMRDKIPELPFSNIWIASQTASKLPENSVLHLGILNSLRSWNFFDTPQSVLAYSNTGGFGIDGGMSTMIGASLANPEKLFFLVIGDLAFFYDMNVLGNRHVGRNLRIMLINNGVGTEFKNYSHQTATLGEDADAFVAAAGHYGKQSPELVKHYAQDLGFMYLSAKTKNEYLKHMDVFLNATLTEKPILFEIFTNSKEESDALKAINHLEVPSTQKMKHIVKEIVGEETVKKLKSIIKR